MFDTEEEEQEEEEQEDEDGLLSAADILGCDDRSYVDVDVSQWWKVEGKGTIRIRSLSAKEAVALTNLEKQESMIQVVARCAIDENGRRMFTDKQVEALKKKSFAAFIAIQKAAMKLNGLSAEEVKND